MSSGEKASERDRLRHEEALPPLPELDDDGTTFDDDSGLEISIGHEHDAHALDDATAEHDEVEAWVLAGASALLGEGREHGLLEDTEASGDAVDVGAHHEGLVDDEKNLLEGSDEPDGREVTADEAGISESFEGTSDDGGAEGTGEDPALALDDQTSMPVLIVEPADDDGVEDESALEDGGQARIRASLEREPWPSRADVAWEVEAIAPSIEGEGRRSAPPPADVKLPGPLREDAMVVVDGALVAVARHGEPLALSLDHGAHYLHILSCTTATAIAAIPGRPGGRVLAVALYDVVTEVSGLAVIRLAEGTDPIAELVADLTPAIRRAEGGDDLEEQGRIETLSARLISGGLIEVIASARSFRLRAKG